MPSLASALSQQIITPRPVASRRPRDPPSSMGLPVTTAVVACPTCMEYVSITQAMVCSPVPTSGAGMSRSGPSQSANSAAERNIHHCAFPRHPGGQRAYLIEGNVRRETDPALPRPAHVGVHYPVSGKNFQRTVVHADGDVQRNFSARPFQETVDALLESQFVRGHLEARFGVLVDVHLFGHWR